MADKSFIDAAHAGNAATLGNLLDTNFEWIAASGKALNRADTLKSLPKPAIADESPAGLNCNQDPNGDCGLTQFTYAQVVHTVTVSSGKNQEVRIWAKRPEGWRLLVYQEVKLADTAPPAAASTGTCDNPCKNIPFTPQDDAQQAVANAYMKLESALASGDAGVWSDLVGYEFMIASSNMPEPMNKSAIAGDGVALRTQDFKGKNRAGLTPVPVANVAMQEFPGVVVMRTRLQPTHGNPLEATSVWILRNNLWIETLNYETAVQPS